MDRIQVSSSNIAAIGYDSSGGVLEVEFLDGSIYHYYDVPEYVHGELMAASSHGSYLNSNIKKNYGYSRI